MTAKLAATQQELQDLKTATRVTEVEAIAASATEEAVTLVAQPATAVLPVEVTSPTPAWCPRGLQHQKHLQLL